VRVYLDGRYAVTLDALSLSELDLQVGSILSPEQINDLFRRHSFQRAYDQALRLLSYRPRSEYEVRQRLLIRGVAPSVAEQVIGKLVSIGLLDDAAFARYWVENRQTFSPRGRRALTLELRGKGVDGTVIEEALRDVVDEERCAYETLQKKTRGYHPSDFRSFRQKFGPYLARRSFGYEVINGALRRLWQELAEQD